jgi:hypothetical protein
MGTSAGIVQALSQVHVPGLLLPVEIVRQLRLAASLFQMGMANQQLMLREVSFWRLEASVLLLAADGPVCLVERAQMAFRQPSEVLSLLLAGPGSVCLVEQA